MLYQRAYQNLQLKPYIFQKAQNVKKHEIYAHMHNSRAVLIDALFGIGLDRPLCDENARLVHILNALPLYKVAVDLPSGLFAEEKKSKAPVLSADWVITFQTPKKALLHASSADCVGKWTCVNIGLSSTYMRKLTAEAYMTEDTDVRSYLPKRSWAAHKGEVGRVLVAAGSKGMMGAALLCLKAALRGGAGLVYAHVPQLAETLISAYLPEVIVHTDSQVTHLTEISVPPNTHAVAVGPGIGQRLPTAAALRKLLTESQVPLILDADALNILSSYPELLKELPKHSLLTPHVGEFRRLAGQWQTEHEKWTLLKKFTENYHCTILLKGAYSLIASPSQPIYINSTGNAGMATAGSGDVLTGVLAALRTHPTLSVWQVALLGAFLHGRAGDLAVQEKGVHSLIANDIIDALPKAFQSLTDLSFSHYV